MAYKEQGIGRNHWAVGGVGWLLIRISFENIPWAEMELLLSLEDCCHSDRNDCLSFPRVPSVPAVHQIVEHFLYCCAIEWEIQCGKWRIWFSWNVPFRIRFSIWKKASSCPSHRVGTWWMYFARFLLNCCQDSYCGCCRWDGDDGSPSGLCCVCVQAEWKWRWLELMWMDMVSDSKWIWVKDLWNLNCIFVTRNFHSSAYFLSAFPRRITSHCPLNCITYGDWFSSKPHIWCTWQR